MLLAPVLFCARNDQRALAKLRLKFPTTTGGSVANRRVHAIIFYGSTLRDAIDAQAAAFCQCFKFQPQFRFIRHFFLRMRIVVA